MDRTNKRYEVERKAVKLLKDRGDTRKPVFGRLSIDKTFPPDRGDSIQKPVFKSIKKFDDKNDSNFGKDSLKKDKSREVKALDAKEKKTIREKYTLKLRSLNHSGISDLNKPDTNCKDVKPVYINKNGDRTIKKNFNNEIDSPKLKESVSNNSGKTITLKQHHDTPRRKPVIKTIMSKNDTMRIFKAVTFVDQKKKPNTPLKISIPTDIGKKQSKIHAAIKPKVKTTVSRVSVKEKPLIKKTGKCKRIRRHVTSPDMSVAHRVRSPPTEVAKWAPTSVNHHTKPYYEAWVDTTLTAISKNYKKDQLIFDKQSIIKSFHKVFEDRLNSPELTYEKLSDEKFTGRIKVRQR